MNNEQKRQAILAKMAEFEEEFGGRSNLPELPAAINAIYERYGLAEDFFVAIASGKIDMQAAIKRVVEQPEVVRELFWMRYDIQSLAYDLGILSVLTRSMGVTLREEGLGEGVKGQRLEREIKQVLDKSMPSAVARAFELQSKFDSEGYGMDIGETRRHVAKSDLFDAAEKQALTDYLRYLRKQLTVLKQEAQDYVDWAKGFSEIQ